MGREPFDLQRLIAGEQVETRAGKKLNIISLKLYFRMKTHKAEYFVLQSMDEEKFLIEKIAYDLHGKIFKTVDSANDLFISAKKNIKYVGVSVKGSSTTAAYPTKCQVQSVIDNFYHGAAFKIIEVEIAEEGMA